MAINKDVQTIANELLGINVVKYQSRCEVLFMDHQMVSTEFFESLRDKQPFCENNP